MKRLSTERLGFGRGWCSLRRLRRGFCFRFSRRGSGQRFGLLGLRFSGRPGSGSERLGRAHLNEALIAALRNRPNVFDGFMVAATIAQVLAKLEDRLRDGLIRHNRSVPKIVDEFLARNHLAAVRRKIKERVDESRRELSWLRALTLNGVGAARN